MNITLSTSAARTKGKGDRGTQTTLISDITLMEPLIRMESLEVYIKLAIH